MKGIVVSFDFCEPSFTAMTRYMGDSRVVSTYLLPLPDKDNAYLCYLSVSFH